jgi:hypothetical protein
MRISSVATKSEFQELKISEDHSPGSHRNREKLPKVVDGSLLIMLNRISSASKLISASPFEGL